MKTLGPIFFQLSKLDFGAPFTRN